MLNLFLKNPKQVLTRQQLLERLWDIDEKYVDEHTLTTSISRIRSKIAVSYTHLDVYKRQIYRCAKEGAQFIIVTHSPILLGIPDADIYCFDNGRCV